MKVIKPAISMRSEPNDLSGLETECLFGESLTVLDEHSDWYFCKLLTDNYCGWIKKINIDHMFPSTHRIISKRTFFFKSNDVKSVCMNYLPLGAQVCVKDMDKKWAKVHLINNNSEFAYIPSNHLIKIGDKINDWVSIAEKLLGTPYVWGGRNSIGLDCSALLQLSYQTYGESIPRNSIDQLFLDKKVIKNRSNLERGFAVFWKGHVGIMTDEFNCIHANAYHMEVSKEPLSDIIKRAGQKNPILKIMNFN